MQKADLLDYKNIVSSYPSSVKGVVVTYDWLAREGHPLYDLSVGMLVRHGIYEYPDGLSPKQRFGLAREGGIQVPEWMDDPLSQKK